ncbi:MAG: hypothetical protein ACEQSU_07140 [Microgenomates group bacterium]
MLVARKRSQFLADFTVQKKRLIKTGQIVKHHIRTMIEYREMHEPNEFARRHDPRLLKGVFGINYLSAKRLRKFRTLNSLAFCAV